MKTVNEQLYELYRSKWDKLIPQLNKIVNGSEDDIPPTNPLLLYVHNEEELKNADIRVMIFGQETKDWGGEPDKSIEHLLDMYNNFCNIQGGYNSPFWHGVATIKALLNAKYPQKRIFYMTNNIIKIGRAWEKGRPPRYNYEVEHEFFHVIPDEIQIIKPNVTLFLTGPNYDYAIHDNFGDIPFADVSPFDKKQLAKLSIPNIDFAFRTYHPGYLQRRGRDYRDNIFKTIVNEIKF